MERRASSGFGAGSDPGGLRPAPEGRSGPAAAALLATATAGGALSIVDPALAIAACSIVYAFVDAPAARLAGIRPPSLARRFVARSIFAVTWSGALAAVAGGHVARTSIAATSAVAVALTFGLWAGTWASSERAATDGPAIALCDASTIVWCFVLSIAARDASPGRRAVLIVAATLAIVLRALLVGRIARWGAARPTSPLLAAIGFVGWLGIAGLSSAMAATAVAWSGLGAAIVLTSAAMLVELRRRRPVVVFLRGATACVFAASFAAAQLLGR